MIDGYPVFALDTCTGCNLCVDVCPMKTLKVDPKTKVVSYADKDSCIFCGHCAAVCPEATISMFGITPKQEEEILNKNPPAIQALKMARTIRMYSSTPMAKDELIKVISIAKYSPSSYNGRPLHFTVLNRTAMDAIGKAVADEMLKNPKYNRIVSSMESGSDEIFRGAQNMILISAPADKAAVAGIEASITARDIQLHAESLGFAIFWGGFIVGAAMKSPDVAAKCGLPEGHKLFMALGIGRPTVKFVRPAIRRDLVEGTDITFK